MRVLCCVRMGHPMLQRLPCFLGSEVSWFPSTTEAALDPLFILEERLYIISTNQRLSSTLAG